MSNSSVTRMFNGSARPLYTPESIDSLQPDEVFVFGSNLKGRHGGGAARAAVQKFGAIWGKGVGIQGQSYAIPTMFEQIEEVRPYVNQFIAFATQHADQFFYVTRIGCGIAGFTDEDMAPLFCKALHLENVCLPESFVDVMRELPSSPATPSFEVPEEYLVAMHGQMRTLMDLLKALNAQEPIRSANDGYNRLESILLANIRQGDDAAFNALRTFWCLMHRYEDRMKPGTVDLDQLEHDMIAFHDQDNGLKQLTVYNVLFHYSVAKMLKYLRFTNEFMRYKSYKEIQEALPSIPASHCSGNSPDYYYSFGGYPQAETWSILQREWDNISRNGVLDNDLLEEVVFGRFDHLVHSKGFEETLVDTFHHVGCHSGILAAGMHEGKNIWAPVYEISDSYNEQEIHIEKGCNDFYRPPYYTSGFEMRFAQKLLERHEGYTKSREYYAGYFKEQHGGYYFVPISDMTLPVYHTKKGKVEFKSIEDKMRAILQIKEKGDFDAD